MTTDAIIMMVIACAGYIGAFAFCLTKVFKNQK